LLWIVTRALPLHTTTRNEPLPTPGAPLHIAAVMMHAAWHDMTDRASLFLGGIVGGPWRIFAVFISNGGFGARGCSRIFGISSASSAISHSMLVYPKTVSCIKRILGKLPLVIGTDSVNCKRFLHKGGPDGPPIIYSISFSPSGPVLLLFWQEPSGLPCR
jgi:hypothetical protein